MTNLKEIGEDADDEDAALNRKAIQDVLTAVLGPLKGPEVSGINFICPDGNRRLCHPILCEYIADYPEQTLLSCTVYQYCPRCTIPKYASELVDVEESNDDTLELNDDPAAEPKTTQRKAPPDSTPSAEPKTKKSKRKALTKSKTKAATKQPKKQKRITLPGSGDIFRTYLL